MSAQQPRVNHRERQMLAAIAAGRGELVCGCEPDLLIDGLWCDRVAAHHLVHTGLVRTVPAAPVGARVHAEITDAGRLALVPRAAAQQSPRSHEMLWGARGARGNPADVTVYWSPTHHQLRW